MAQIREELVLYDRFTQTFTSYIRQANQAAVATTAAKNATQTLGAAQKTTAASANSAASATQKFASAQRAAQSSAMSLGTALKSVVSLYAVIQSVRWVGSMSDHLASTTARLDMMNDGLQTTAELQQMIYDSAQRSRGLYTDTAAFVAKLGNLAGNAFSSNSELVSFAEQINKQIALSGTTATEASAAMLQLTQGLSSGMLRGEELNSVLEQTPMIAKTIADYMGVTTGEMRNLASEGKVTAEVVKNAMLSAADETNAKFEEMPMTWAQRFNQFKNVAVQALQPLFDAVNKLANSDFIEGAISGATVALQMLGSAVNWVVDNINVLAPVLAIATSAWVAYKVAVWAANIAMYANPIGLVIAAIVALVGVLLWAWESFEGFRVFMAGVWASSAKAYAAFYNFGAEATRNFVSFVINRFYDLGVNVAKAVNGMLTPIRLMAEAYNAVAGAVGAKTIGFDFSVSTDKIAAMRDSALASLRASIPTLDLPATNAAIDALAGKASNFTLSGFISDRLADVSSAVSGYSIGAVTPYTELAGMADALGGIASDVSGIKKSVSMSDEDLKSLVDMAERRYVNQVNLTAQTPVITVNGANTGRTAADRQALANAIRDMLIEQSAAGSVRSTAVPVMG